MTTIDDLITQTYEQTQAEAARQQQLREAAEQQAIEEAITAFRAALTAELGQDVIEALGVEFGAYRRSMSKDIAESATFVDRDCKWQIAINGRGRDNTVLNWWVKVLQTHTNGRIDLPNQSIKAGALRNSLLALIGRMRVSLQKDADEQALQKERREQQRIKEDRFRAERAQVVAQLDAKHHELNARIQSTVDEAQRLLWTWPEGVAVDLYRLSFATGTGRNEDGEACVEYDGGWTDSDALDEQGYITIQPKRWTARRVLRLTMEHHKPVWERVTVGSFDELPDELKEPVDVAIPGVAWQHCAEDHQYRFVEDAENVYRERLENAVPLDWVRQMVDLQS